MAWAQNELVEALEEAPRYLVEPYHSRVVRAGELFKEVFAALAEPALDEGRKQWKYLRKFHPFLHLLDDMASERLNCRYWSCWTDETLMGQVITMISDQDVRTATLNVLSAWFPMFIERLRQP